MYNRIHDIANNIGGVTGWVVSLASPTVPSCERFNIRLRSRTAKVFAIVLPLQRAIGNVFTNAILFCLVADDVFVIVALSDRYAGGIYVIVDATRRECLEAVQGRGLKPTYNNPGKSAPASGNVEAADFRNRPAETTSEKLDDF